MSIASEITRIVNAKAALRTAINAKGGTIATTDKLGAFAAQVDALVPAEFGNRVRFFDYDGTLLKTMYVADGEDAVPPANPVHAGLTFNSWNVPYDDVTGDVDVGAVFAPTSGKTEIDLRELVDERNYTLNFSITSGSVAVDWGDGSTAQTVTASGSVAHTYMQRGNYTITITPGSGAVWAPGQYFCNGGSSGWETATQAVRFCGITSLPSYCLYRHRSLRSVLLPAGLATIGEYAFCQCYALRSVIMPDSITTLGSRCFSNAYLLARVVLGDGCATLPENIFESCRGILDIVMPSGITTLASNVFNSCRGLKEVFMPDSITALGSGAFYGCCAMRELRLPAGITVLQSETFRDCYALRKVVLPPNVTEIKYRAFYQCYALQEITLQTGITKIGEYAFYECNALRDVVLPATVTQVDYSAFYNTNMRSITIPAALTYIGYSAFYTPGMLDVKMLATTVPTIDSTDVFGDNANRRIEVPAASLTAYKAATNWSSMADNIFAAEA